MSKSNLDYSLPPPYESASAGDRTYQTEAHGSSALYYGGSTSAQVPQPVHASSSYHHSPSPSPYPEVQSPPAHAQGSFITRIFSGESSNPLDPPPPSFSRPVPQYVAYEPFPTMVTLGLGKDLGDGFMEMPPPSVVQPHPFARHDVQEADWLRFLADIKAAGKLSTRENVTAAVLPMTMNLGLTGMLVSKGIQNRQIKKKQEPCGRLVDAWNSYFFLPRRLEVILAKGDTRLSGNTGIGAPPSRRHEDDSYSSSSGDEGMSGRSELGLRSDRRAGRQVRREEKRERRQERREERDARRAKRKQERANKKEQFRLIVVPA